ncbi:MAG: hypothetical protein JXA81_03530 [Sedimentisphaerales bacterium]|nr:hypothetical protein [Sedimentisphaerales bacterium]
MKQPRLFPPVLVSFIAIVLVNVSHLSASVTFWDDFNSAASGYYDSVDHWGDNFTTLVLYLYEYNSFKILQKNDSARLHSNPDEIRQGDLFQNILLNETFYVIPDELLTQQIISQASIPEQSSELDNDMQSTSEPADYIVFDNDADNIESLRIPAPSSLLLVAFGLLSLRYTRSLKL